MNKGYSKETKETAKNLRIIDDDVPRTRFYASLVTSNHTPKGTRFSDVPDVTIVYISEYDALKIKG